MIFQFYSSKQIIINTVFKKAITFLIFTKFFENNGNFNQKKDKHYFIRFINSFE